MHVDVIVVGAGLAGYRAALEAAALGADVALLEKLPQGGGSTVESGGAFAFCGTDFQAAAGVEDDTDLLLADLRAEHSTAERRSLLEVYARGQLAEYAYLRALGITFYDLQKLFGHTVARCHRADPRLVLQSLHQAAESHDAIQCLFSTPAALLERDSDGVVRRVVASRNGQRLRLHAQKGIILASGGFSRARELLTLFQPRLAGAVLAGGAGNTGDGIRMAWQHGADLADVGFVRGSFGVHVSPEGASFGPLYAVARGAIAVNKAGERFVDESLSYKLLGDACLAQPEAVAFQIFDAGIMADSHPKTAVFNFRRALEAGLLVEAGSIAELAVAIGVPSDRLEATIRSYNADAEQGYDGKFGRTTLSGAYGSIRPIVHAPYYAFASTTVVTGTYAGIRINSDMAVLDVYGHPIGGLYAAGEVTGGFHGEAYTPGTALVMALVFGAAAASSAVTHPATATAARREA